MSARDMEMNFCRRCGAKLTFANENAYTCEDGHTIFLNPAPTVGVFFLTQNDTHVLLAERGIEPHKGMLDSFGGFLNTTENTMQALERELREELGLEPAQYELPTIMTTAFSYYPYGGEDMPVVSTFYWTRLRGNQNLVSSDDVSAIVELELKNIDYAQLHADDVRAGMKALQQQFLG